jgi:1,4-dihydroxy-2-naphthoate octaprenyltransferase
VLHPSTIQLLRFHFSFFLLPVFLFALSFTSVVNWSAAVGIFFILHLLVYPASNGYNSYMDKDDAPIGGLEHPMQPTYQLFIASLIMDLAALMLSLLINWRFSLCVLVYIAASRAYSYRGIRLKKLPIIGFLTVFIFQGGFVFWSVMQAVEMSNQSNVSWTSILTASLLIGALYPLTQIYQHEADRKDGVITISYLLGMRGTFLFSMIQFLLAASFLFFHFNQTDQFNLFLLFLLMTLPVVLFFLYWMWKVWKNEEAANFSNSFRMNVIATVCITVYFSTLIILKHFE